MTDVRMQALAHAYLTGFIHIGREKSLLQMKTFTYACMYAILRNSNIAVSPCNQTQTFLKKL